MRSIPQSHPVSADVFCRGEQCPSVLTNFELRTTDGRPYNLSIKNVYTPSAFLRI